MKVKCVICNKEFEAIKTTKKYCSKECANQARRNKWKIRDKIEKEKHLMPEKICPICNKIFRPLDQTANSRICCYDCVPSNHQLTRGEFLAKIKLANGGKCVRCGYNVCLKALEFHHINPKEKEFTISNDRFRLLEAIKESKKCILLCSNCHKEFHDNLWTLEEINIERS